MLGHTLPNGRPHWAAPNQMESVVKSRWWNVFDAMVEIAFKPTVGGYVYRAPSLWPFASSVHYLVNEQQKAVLTGYHLGMFRTLFWLIVVGAGVGGPLAGAFLSGGLWLKLGISLLVGLAMGLGASTWLVRKVRPIIAGLEPSEASRAPDNRSAIFKKHWRRNLAAPLRGL